MSCQRMVVAAVLAVCGFASSAPAATTLYQEVFNPPAAGQSGAILPWSINMIGGYAGTYDGGFAASGLIDGDTNAPIGRTGPTDLTGTAVYTGIGGPVTGALRAFYTVDGQAGFTAVDPALHPGLMFNIWANLQQGGADDFGTFIFEGQSGGARGPKQWYASSTPMASPTVSAALFNLRSLLYNSAAGNWNLLTLDPTNTVSPIVGGPAGAIPAGTQIVGVGVLQSDTNPAPNADFSNDAFSSWNYADYRLTDGAIPEPATLLMLALGAPAIWVFRHRR
jgi:PEP-CTERM motif